MLLFLSCSTNIYMSLKEKKKDSIVFSQGRRIREVYNILCLEECRKVMIVNRIERWCKSCRQRHHRSQVVVNLHSFGEGRIGLGYEWNSIYIEERRWWFEELSQQGGRSEWWIRDVETKKTG